MRVATHRLHLFHCNSGVWHSRAISVGSQTCALPRVAEAAATPLIRMGQDGALDGAAEMITEAEAVHLPWYDANSLDGVATEACAQLDDGRATLAHH